MFDKLADDITCPVCFGITELIKLGAGVEGAVELVEDDDSPPDAR